MEAGRVIADGTAKEVFANKTVVEAYLGGHTT
jgi:ABC-type branched-subunit amino acid transport system ATPase component